MRVAPVGLYLGGKENFTIEDVDYCGAEVAALTHGHPLGYIPAAALSHLIALLAHSDMSLEDAVDEMKVATSCEYGESDEQWYYGDFRDLVDKACFLAEDKNISDQEAIRELGEGWVAEEAFAIAIFCALRYSRDFDKAIIAAVNHDGDSDSTGAITGNILGAYLGLSAIPEKYIAKLELKDVIMEVADDLYHDCQIADYSPVKDPEWEQKYSLCERWKQL